MSKTRSPLLYFSITVIVIALLTLSGPEEKSLGSNVRNVMDPPPSPIFNSGLWNIIIFFVVLNILAWVAGYFLTRFFLTLKKSE